MAQYVATMYDERVKDFATIVQLKYDTNTGIEPSVQFALNNLIEIDNFKSFVELRMKGNMKAYNDFLKDVKEFLRVNKMLQTKRKQRIKNEK